MSHLLRMAQVVWTMLAIGSDDCVYLIAKSNRSGQRKSGHKRPNFQIDKSEQNVCLDYVVVIQDCKGVTFCVTFVSLKKIELKKLASDIAMTLERKTSHLVQN